MRIGTCASLEECKTLREIGYDYAEIRFSRIVRMSDEEFEQAQTSILQSGLLAEVCNLFFPSDFRLYAYDPLTQTTTEAFDEIKKSVYSYTRLGFSRAKQLGTEVVVIGSGGVRRRPADLSPDLALRQLAEILIICADVAAEYGIAVTVEHLNEKETNVLVTLAEVLDLMDEIGHPNLYAMNDYYHSYMQNESFSTLDRAGSRLKHIHICRPDRQFCTLADRETLLPYVQYLSHLGYHGRISFEGSVPKESHMQALREVHELLTLFRDL